MACRHSKIDFLVFGLVCVFFLKLAELSKNSTNWKPYNNKNENNKLYKTCTDII